MLNMGEEQKGSNIRKLQFSSNQYLSLQNLKLCSYPPSKLEVDAPTRPPPETFHFQSDSQENPIFRKKETIYTYMVYCSTIFSALQRKFETRNDYTTTFRILQASLVQKPGYSTSLWQTGQFCKWKRDTSLHFLEIDTSRLHLEPGKCKGKKKKIPRKSFSHVWFHL